MSKKRYIAVDWRWIDETSEGNHGYRAQARTGHLRHNAERKTQPAYAGSYARVAAFARAWRDDRHRVEQTTGRGTFVPLVFQPGEAFQFDWSEPADRYI